MAQTTLLGVYTYQDKTDFNIFVDRLKRVSPGVNFICVTQLQEGLYGFTHYKAYLDYLKTSDADFVIFTDIRDVVIQRDLSTFPRGELSFYGEYEGQTIGNCPYNSMWIRQYYGEDMVQKLHNKQIINCSVVSGFKPEMIRYCETMLDNMGKFGEHHTGLDMAVHNHLYYVDNYPAKLWGTLGPVYTCGYSPEIRVKQHTILNPSGEVPHIVHQFDRHLGVL